MDDDSGATQIFIAAWTGINPLRMPFIRVGAPVKVVGLASQSLTEYEIRPRSKGDLQDY